MHDVYPYALYQGRRHVIMMLEYRFNRSLGTGEFLVLEMITYMFMVVPVCGHELLRN